MAQPTVPAMRPPGSPVAPGPAHGDLLAGRYRLDERIALTETTVLWRAVDQILARPVAVKVLLSPSQDARRRFLGAATAIGAVHSPLLARVYDAAVTGPPGGEAYVVAEWLPGVPLHRLLDNGPLPVAQVISLMRGAADALSAAHAAGVSHGRVHPGNIFLGPDGRVRLSDASLAAAAHDDPPASRSDGVTADTRDLAATAYALLTGRWPGGPSPQPGGALALAPRAAGLVRSPRQLRAAVPRAVDRVVLAALDPRRAGRGLSTRSPDAFASALEETVRPSRSGGRAVVGRLRRRLPLVLGAAALAGLGFAGYRTGLALGALPVEPGEPAASRSSASLQPAPAGAGR